MKKIAYIGCLGLIGIITTEFGIIGILPQIAQHYHISIDKAGMLLSAFALVIATTGPFVTLFFSNFNRKKIMLAAMAIFLFTGVVSSLAPPFWLLMVARMLPAFLQPVYISTAIAAAINAADKKDEHRMMAIVMGGISIATVTTIPFATYMAGVFNWQASFTIQAIVSALALLLIFIAIPSMPVTNKTSYKEQLSILTRTNFLLSLLMNFLMISAWFSTYSYFADYLGKVKHMDQNAISSMMLIFGITGVLGNWLAGKALSKNIPLTTALFLSGTIIIPIGLQYSGADQLLPNSIIIAIWGLLYAPCFLTAGAYIISAAPHSLEFSNSLAISTGNLGVSVGTAVSGWVIATNGIHQAPWVGMGFGILALTIIMVRSLREAKVQKPQVCV